MQWECENDCYASEKTIRRAAILLQTTGQVSVRVSTESKQRPQNRGRHGVRF